MAKAHPCSEELWPRGQRGSIFQSQHKSASILEKLACSTGFICLGDGDEARNGRQAGGGEEARGSMGRKAETGEKKQVAPQDREGRNYAQEIGN